MALVISRNDDTTLGGAISPGNPSGTPETPRRGSEAADDDVKDLATMPDFGHACPSG